MVMDWELELRLGSDSGSGLSWGWGWELGWELGKAKGLSQALGSASAHLNLSLLSPACLNHNRPRRKGRKWLSVQPGL